METRGFIHEQVQGRGKKGGARQGVVSMLALFFHHFQSGFYAFSWPSFIECQQSPWKLSIIGCEGHSNAPLCHTAILSPLFITSTAKTFAQPLSQMSFPIPFHFAATSNGAITPKYLQNIFITIPIIAVCISLLADCCSRFANDSNIVSISPRNKSDKQINFLLVERSLFGLCWGLWFGV